MVTDVQAERKRKKVERAMDMLRGTYRRPYSFERYLYLRIL